MNKLAYGNGKPMGYRKDYISVCNPERAIPHLKNERHTENDQKESTI